MLGSSWLLTGCVGSNTSRILGSVLWLAAIVGFVGAGWGIIGLVGNVALWRTLAIVSVVVSLSIIGMFAGPGATWNVGGAVVGNIVATAAIVTGSLWT